MAILSIAALKAQVDAQINTNGINSITGALLNQNIIDTIDSLVANPVDLGYKSYLALLSQTGTSAPVPTILKDEITGVTG